MALNPPPIQEVTTDVNNGRFPLVWIRWFLSIKECIDALDVGGTGSDGIMDGGRRTSGAALFDGGRRV